ncbi:hypothetical protein TMEC54S_03045 [Thauera mechernichensis]
MARFDVYRNSAGEGFLLDVQADLLSHLNTRVVVPLLPPGCHIRLQRQTLERAEGSKPMSIHWRLGVPLPGRLFREFSILRGA